MLYESKNGAIVTHDKNTINGIYTVLLRDPVGNIFDKVSLDNYKNSLDYYKAFKAIAKNL